MPRRDVGDFFGQADEQAEKRAVSRMPQRRQARPRALRFPALAVLGVELPRLADVVADSTRDDDVAVDRKIRIELGQFVGNPDRETRDATDVIGLIASLEDHAAGISGWGHGADRGVAAVRKSDRPGLYRLIAQRRVANFIELGEFVANPFTMRVGDARE